MTKYNLQACSDGASAGTKDGKEHCSVSCRTHDWNVQWVQHRDSSPWAGTFDRDGAFQYGVTYMQNELMRKHMAIVKRYRKQVAAAHAQLDAIFQAALDHESQFDYFGGDLLNGGPLVHLFVDLKPPPS